MGANTTAMTKLVTEYDACPLPVTQKVINVHVENPVGDAAWDMRVPIPFKGYLSSVYAVVSRAIDSSCGTFDIDAEKTAAGGTALFNFSIPSGSAAVLEVSGTFETAATNTVRLFDNDYINLEVSPSNSGPATGAIEIFMIFEPHQIVV